MKNATPNDADITNARAIRFLEADEPAVQAALADSAQGRRPDFEDMARIHFMASDWAKLPQLHPRVKTDLNRMAIRAGNVLAMGC